MNRGMMSLLCAFVTTFFVGGLISLDAVAQEPMGHMKEGDVYLESIQVEGLVDTKLTAITDLLPRPIPSVYTKVEIDEFSRRIKNLRLFDVVEVNVEGAEVVVNVRPKMTLAPIVDLSTGKTLLDSSLTVGVIEHNVDKNASRLFGELSYENRGFNFSLGYFQHPYIPDRWAQEYILSYAGTDFRFEGDERDWVRHRLGGLAEVISPLSYSHKLQLEFALLPYYEWNVLNDKSKVAPQDGMHLGGLAELIYDAYKWDDLAPSGVKMVLELRPGYFTAGHLRAEARFELLAAKALTEKTAITLYHHMAVVNPGDVNHSLLLGSQSGVRGLDDSFYRNAAHSYSNVELRHAVKIIDRLYLQGVVFTDAAVFLPMDKDGELTHWMSALSSGGGVRVLPTAMVDFLLRRDVARLFLPEQAWFFQVGISQYF